MSLESAIMELAQAIQTLAATASQNAALQDPRPVKNTATKTASKIRSVKPVCMDEAGVPTSFKRRCGICGELGRYRSSHKEEMKDGTHHWVEVKA